MSNYYRVLVDDLTVNADGPEITDMFGQVIGYQTVSATHAKGTVLSEDQVSEAQREAVENGQTEGYLEKVGSSDYEESLELAEPFPGYNDLAVEDVQAAFKVLPSEAIRAVMEYEASEHGQNRAGIVDYHIGRGEAFTDRMTGRASSPVQDPAEKEIANIVSREVDTEKGDFRFGEGPQDDGTPQREVYSLDGDTRMEGEKLEDGDSKPRARRSRRSKAADQANAGDSKSDSKDDDKKDDSES